MAKIAPATTRSGAGNPAAIAERQEGREQHEGRQRERDRTGADLAQHLAAVELPHRHEIGDVEERGDAGKRAEHACRGAPALAGGIGAGGDRDRHEEGGEARRPSARRRPPRSGCHRDGRRWRCRRAAARRSCAPCGGPSCRNAAMWPSSCSATTVVSTAATAKPPRVRPNNGQRMKAESTAKPTWLAGCSNRPPARYFPVSAQIFSLPSSRLSAK